jgi:hypothetical protein
LGHKGWMTGRRNIWMARRWLRWRAKRVTGKQFFL